MDVLSDDLASIYQRLTTTISKEEFAARVRQKVEDMSGLCDEKTAALLVAHELGIDTVVQIAQIDAQTELRICWQAHACLADTRVLRDGDVGYVANLVVSDATGSIRVVLVE